jgi:5-amino-6-(5-phosphoribosylamino)uracil reductase
MTVDGYIDDSSPTRLLLSNDADFDRVDAVRADSDAILVGADTIRRDNPRLMVRSEHRRRQRTHAGRSPIPIKVTLTRTGNLDPNAQFFTTGDVPKLVYAAGPIVPTLARTLRDTATVIDAGDPTSLDLILADLHARGVRRLMVEGGGTIHTQFLTAGLADELYLVVAPFFVGDSAAPRFVRDGTYPFGSNHRMTLLKTEAIDDVVLLHYALSGTHHD